jgi:hypothetical protein
MRVQIVFLLSLIISVPFFASAEPDFDPSSQQTKLACLFAKPLIFGASISAGYSGVSDATAAFIHLKTSPLLGTDPHYFGANPDPVTRLAKKYNKDAQITNISEIINQMQYGSVGVDQFFGYISESPENLNNAKSSSVLASIDGLYWPAIYGDDCSWTEYAIHKTREIIQFAKKNQIPMLLGSVPDEDPSKVSMILTGSGGWVQPKQQCVKMTNDFLHRECRVEDQCYILDMHAIVENLKGSNGPHDHLGIWFQGENYDYNQFRSDGVHLWNQPKRIRKGVQAPSIPDGMKYVMTYIEKSVAWNLNSCK